MRIMFILDYSFPSSTAPSNRIETLVKSFMLRGNNVDILCINGTFRSKKVQTETVSEYNTIYSFSSIRPKNFLKRNLYKITGYLKSFFVIFKENRKNKIDAIFLPRRNPFIIFWILVFCRILKIRTLQEISEYPEVFLTGFMSKMDYYFNKIILYRYLDGLVVMTNFLYDYFMKMNIGDHKITVIPMSVDVKRFQGDIKKNISESFIAYCGSINKEKDGLDILIRSFSEIVEEIKGIKLYIIGQGQRSVLNNLKAISDELGTSSEIIYLGFVSRDDIPDIIKQAKILVLSRPKSIQAEGGFPTKLGEYLSTKKPVVITNVGEVSNYLKDGESAYIAEPDSVESFAKKMKECLDDYKRAQMIGEKGYQVAVANFDFRSHSEKLCSFIDKLI